MVGYSNHQVLQQEGLMTLEARSLRDRYLHHLVLDGDPRRHLARNRRFPFLLSRVVHATWFTWLDVGSALQAFRRGTR
jgi:hypothetical protein